MDLHRKHRPIQALLLLLIMAGVLALFSCGKEKPEAASKDLIVGIESAPKTLDPRYATDAYGMRITQHLVFNTLVKLGYSLQIVPELAESWETPNDTTYIFNLKPGVTFHDGKPLTAEDVKFTFEHLMDPETKSPFAAVYRDKITSIKVLSPQKVQFNLTQPVASFLTTIIMPILPRHIVEKSPDFSKELIGTGAFKLKAQTPTELILEVNNPKAEKPPGFNRIVFKIIKDDNTRFLKMKKGELDLVINAMPSDKINAFKEAPLNEIYDIVETPGISYNYIAFNMDDPTLKDIRVRQAIAYGIDVQSIIDFKHSGHANVATGLLSPVNWFYEKEVPLYMHSPEMATKLLDEAGFTDPDGEGNAPRLVIEMKTSNNAEVVGIARVIQSQLLKIGIQLDIKSFEWGTFYGDIKSGNFQMTSMKWVGVTEPDFYYDIFHSGQIPPTGRNRGRYQNTTIDQLVTEGRTTLDLTKRKEIYANVQKIAAQELPYISLWHKNNVSLVNKRVSGYRQHPQAGYFSFKEIQLK